MADGSIGGQIRDNLSELGKQAVGGTVKAVSDVAGGTMETVMKGGMPTSEVMPEKQQAGQAGGQDPAAVKKQEGEAVKRRQLSYVRQQLEVYRQRQGQQKVQEQQKVQKEEAERGQVKQSQKAREDQAFLARLKRSFGGAHEGDSKALG